MQGVGIDGMLQLWLTVPVAPKQLQLTCDAPGVAVQGRKASTATVAAATSLLLLLLLLLTCP
jgi:hypothetical protein